MKKIILVFILLIIAAIGYAAYKYRGAAPALPYIKTEIRSDDLGLTTDPNYAIKLYAEGLGSPRVLAVLDGILYTTITKEGTVVRLEDKDLDGVAETKEVILSKLRNPHGLLFYQGYMYLAEEDQISRFTYDPSTKTLGSKQKIYNLPTGGRHFTRSLLVNKHGGKDRLFVSIGSTCDVCFEKDERIASVVYMNPDGTDAKVFAKGLRNAVFLTGYQDKIYVTEMGRDNLGDNIPPDEINILEKEGQDFGWPICYGNKIHDTKFDNRQYIRDPCADTIAPYIELQAHSAPLGLAFDSDGSLFVAYHGSWNRTVPTGYKVVRFSKGSKDPQDFVTGWLSGRTSSGRPAGIVFDSNGNMYVSDDKAGMIYKIIKK